jgi:AraC-like DNA-binding protein
MYYSTINDIKRILKANNDQGLDNSDIGSIKDLIKLTYREHSPDEYENFPNPIAFADMSDQDFLDTLNDLPIFLPQESVHASDFEYNFLFEHRDIYAFSIPNYIYEPLHQNGYVVINCVLQGQCEQHFEGERRILTSGCLCILAPSSNYRMVISNDDCIAIRIGLRKEIFDATFFNILAPCQILSSYFSSVIYNQLSSNYILFEMDDDIYFRRFVREIFCELYAHDNYSVKGALSRVVILFCHMLRSNRNIHIFKDFSQQHSSSFPKILQYIQDNYIKLTLESLAKTFNYSPSYISRLIKKNTGQNLSQIVQALKLERTKDYLRNTSKTIDEITSIVGYESPSYLSRAFKAEFSVSPQVYRNQNTKKA